MPKDKTTLREPMVNLGLFSKQRGGYNDSKDGSLLKPISNEVQIVPCNSSGTRAEVLKASEDSTALERKPFWYFRTWRCRRSELPTIMKTRCRRMRHFSPDAPSLDIEGRCGAQCNVKIHNCRRGDDPRYMKGLIDLAGLI